MSYWSLLALCIPLLYLVYNRRLVSSADMSWLLPEAWRTQQAPTSIPDTSVESSLDTGTTQAVNKDESLDDSESTPKANATEPASNVPSFNLSMDDDDKSDDTTPEQSVPSFPAANSAQRASAMPPPKLPNVKSARSTASSLMPPPARVPATLRPPPSAASSLRAPPNGLPANSQQRASGGLSARGAVPTPNARNKIHLSPGHSPMDWAALARSKDLAGVSSFQKVTPSQLRSMTGRRGKPAWSSWQGKVYNITPYLKFHPGGEAELMKAAGRDGEKLFMEVHGWVNWENMLGSCLVGVMVAEDYGKTSELDEMD